MEKAVVIGAGIGGLAAGLRLAAKGYKVDILEKSASPGGKLSEFHSNGYRFDTGPSLFTLPTLVAELFDLFGKSVKEYLPVKELDVTCNYFFPDGSTLKAWSDKGRFIDEAVRCGADPVVVVNYLEKQSFLYRYTSDFFLFNSIHKISTYTGEAGRRSLKALHRLDAATTMHRRNEKTFGKSNLVQLFDRYATYNGSNPYRAPATLNMIAHLEHNTGAFYPENGMYGIIRALVKLAGEEGVTIHLNTLVSGVKTEGKKVSSVITDQGEFDADIVINSTDITSFYRKIMPNRRILSIMNRRERSSSALIFYWGVDFTSELDVHNILFSSDYKAEFDGLFKTKRFANDLTVYIFISKKVVESDAPKDCENWFVMVNAPENVGQDWQLETTKVREIILSKIEKRLGVKLYDHIQTEQIMTPVDIETRTGSVNGSLYGHSSNGAMAAFLRHPNFSRQYKNLFFVGGSVHPGGGIPLCLASAKIVDGMIAPSNEQYPQNGNHSL
jgi:phytoene desaturase